jgi:transketolase
MRTAFINQLIEEARKNSKVFLIVGDLGFSVVEPFVEEFPQQFLNIGIAEQNMAGVAAGLAMEGYCVYIYSIANFPTLRCIEQIRYDICYHNLNVKIIAVGGGFAYGPLGPSHHATEEIGMLRTIPNLTICAPGDPIEASEVTKLSANTFGPFYIRLGKAGEPVVHESNIVLSIGNCLPILSGKKNAVFTMGATLKYAKDFVINNSLNASVYSFPFIKPLNKLNLLEIFLRYENIITIEEHQSSAGFGSAILEVLNDLQEEDLIQLNQIPRIRRVAIPNKFYSIAGTQNYLRNAAGIKLEKYFFNIKK